MSFHRVLCAVDFSEMAALALEEAIGICKQTEATLLLLHVLPAPYASELPPEAWRTFTPDSEQSYKALEQWAERARKAGCKQVETLRMMGEPWQRITASALERGCDLVVMGSHSRQGLERFLLGSVAERVVRHAPCSVLTVRPPPA